MARKKTHFETVRSRPGDGPSAKGSSGSLYKVHLLVRCKLKAQGSDLLAAVSESEICDKAKHDFKILAVKQPRVCSNGRSSVVILMDSGKVCGLLPSN